MKTYWVWSGMQRYACVNRATGQIVANVYRLRYREWTCSTNAQGGQYARGYYISAATAMVAQDKMGYGV